MRKVGLAVILVFSLMLIFSVVPAHAQQKNVVVIHLDQEIDPGSANMIVQTLKSLNSQNTQAVIIDMNTPGGLLSSMLQMINAINQTEASGVPVYTYIPADGMGASAGSYVAMASDVIAMGSGSYIGPSTPIVVGGTSLQQNHTEAAMQALMVSMAASHHRNTTAAAIMVSNNVAYDSATAVNIHIADMLSKNLTTFLATENLSSYHINNIYPSVYDNFISFLSNPFVDGIFILLGAIAIMADFYHGSVVLSVAGIALIALGFLGAEIISASIVGLLLLVIGAALILVEIKTGHGASMISGVVVGVVGTFLLAAPYSSSNPGYSPSPYGIFDFVTAGVIVIFAVILGLMFKHMVSSLKRRRYTGAESLIDKQATVKKALSPTGWVSIEGVMWKAMSTDGSTIPVGETVIVTNIDGLTLKVRRE